MLNTHRAFRRVVTGRNAAWYMLTMVIAFAITVVGTRLYLDITGYPQLGNSTFHFAHALWGGLLQVVATVLILIYLNEWVFSLAAVLAGVGIGLFIDEIGKFITQTNDYFFPLAAPIIYIAFILFVFAYLYIRRHRREDSRATLYGVLEDMEMLLDDNLDLKTHRSLVHRLDRVKYANERPDLTALAGRLLQFLASEHLNIKPPKATYWSVFLDRLAQLEERWLPQSIVHRLLILAFTVLGAISLFKIAVLLSIVFDQHTLSSPLLADFIEDNPLVRSVYSLNWYVVLLTIESIIGILYAVAVLGFLGNRNRVAIQISSTALILSLTVSNTLAFYFNQFSVVLDSLLLTVVLLLLARYRARSGFTQPQPANVRQPSESHHQPTG